MEFEQKREVSRRIADPSKIEIYRSLLTARRVPSAGMKRDDPALLARELVYTALSFYSEEDIISACSGGDAATEPAKAAVIQPASDVKPHKKASKYEEYPKIPWRDLDNTLVRTADAIFSDRINLHQALRALERGLDVTRVKSELLAEFIDKTIRMALCFRELKTFNDKGEFYGKHPFISQKTERERLTELLRSDPSRFLEEMHNVEGNISRYKSHAKSPKLSADKRKKEAENLAKYEALKKMYQEVFDENIKR